MDEIEKRLKETSDNCFNAYEAWHKDKKDSKARETLQEAVHEIRKIASRMEIELAVAERDDMAQKPIPIPPHRDAKRKGGKGGDGPEKGNESAPKKGPAKKGPPKKAASGNDD